MRFDSNAPYLQKRRELLGHFRNPTPYSSQKFSGEALRLPATGATGNTYPADIRYFAAPVGAAASLKTVFQALDRVSTGLRFKDNPGCWERYYVFPSSNTVNAYYSSREGRKWRMPFSPPEHTPQHEKLINASKKAATQWLTKLFEQIDHCRKNRKALTPLIIIKGDVGCGKSSFLKYLCSIHKALFIENRVIPSRIEFAKMRSFFKENPNGLDTTSNVVHYAFRCIIRDIKHYLFRFEEHGSFVFDYQKGTFTPDFVQYLKKRIIASSTTNLLSPEPFDNFDQIFDRRMENIFRSFQMDDDTTLLNADRRFHESLIKYLQDYGYEFLIIFDGMDAISVDEIFFKNEFLDIIKAIGNYAGTNKKRTFPGSDTKVYLSFIAVMRTTTASRLAAYLPPAVGVRRIIDYFVIAPSIHELYHSRFNKIRDELTSDHQDGDSDIGKEQLLHLVNTLEQEVMDIIDECKIGERHFSAIFADNCRLELEYLRYLMIDLCTRISEGNDGKPISTDLFIQYINEGALKEFFRQKAYLMIEILMIKDKTHFRNFVNVSPSGSYKRNGTQEDIQGTYGQLTESGAKYSFVDNIFNYYFDDNVSSKRPPFCIEKIRILQILRHYRTLPLNEIMARLKKFFGYDMDRGAVVAELAILVRVNFVASSYDGRSINYYLTPCGEVTIDSLFSEMIYIENIVHQTLLPDTIASLIWSMRKYPDGQKGWPLASIKNCYVLLRWIATIELLEQKFATDSAQRDLKIPGWRISRVIGDKLASTIGRMVDEDFNDKRDGRVFLIDQALNEIRTVNQLLPL